MCFLFNRMVAAGSFRRIFGFFQRPVFTFGFGVADDSLIDSPAYEMTDITDPDRDDVSGRADYDRYGDD
jgi:hypothetical protein